MTDEAVGKEPGNPPYRMGEKRCLEENQGIAPYQSQQFIKGHREQRSFVLNCPKPLRCDVRDVSRTANGAV